MKNELTYLLEELDNWDDDKPIQVKDLKKMIEKSCNRIIRDQEEFDEGIVEVDYIA